MPNRHPSGQLQRLLDTLRSNRFLFSNEDELQRGISLALQGARLSFEREVWLSADDRPDFMVGGTAVEVKVDGTANALIRQLLRYAAHPMVHSLVVVTNRARLTDIPRVIGGKPVFVVSLLEGGL